MKSKGNYVGSLACLHKVEASCQFTERVESH